MHKYEMPALQQEVQNEIMVIPVPVLQGLDELDYYQDHLTPDLLSDHLFSTIGKITTRAPNITIAYI